MNVHAHHIDPSMLAIMDLVVSHDRTAVCSDLNSSQRISINIISLNKASTITKYVNAPLVSIEDGISPRISTETSFIGVECLVKCFTSTTDLIMNISSP